MEELQSQLSAAREKATLDAQTLSESQCALSALQQQLAALATQHTELQQYCDKECQRLRSQLEVAQQSNAAVQQQCESQGELLHQANTRCAELEAHVQATHDSTRQRTQQLLDAHAAETEAIKEELRTSHVRAVSQLQQTLEAQLTATVAQGEEAVREWEQTKAQFTSRVQELSQELERRQAELLISQEQLRTAEGGKEQEQQSANYYREQLETAKREHEAEQQEWRTSDAVREKLIGEHVQRLQESQRQLQSVEEEREKKEEQRWTAQKQLDEVSRQLEIQGDEHQRQATRLNASLAECTSLQNQCRELQAEKNVLSERASELGAAVQVAEEKRDASHQELLAMQQEMERLQTGHVSKLQELDTLKLEQKETQLRAQAAVQEVQERTQEQVCSLESELAVARASRSEEEVRRTRSDASVQELQQECHRLRTVLVEMEQAHSEQQQQQQQKQQQQQQQSTPFCGGDEGDFRLLLSASTTKNAELQRALDAAEDRVLELESQALKLHAAVNESSSHSSVYRSSLRVQEQRVHELEGQLATSGVHVALREENEQLLFRYETTLTNSKKMEQKVKSLEAKTKMLQQRLEKAQGANTKAAAVGKENLVL